MQDVFLGERTQSHKGVDQVWDRVILEVSDGTFGVGEEDFEHRSIWLVPGTPL